MKAQKRQTPKSENAMDIVKLTVVFEMKRIEVPEFLERLKNSKSVKYLYCWLNTDWNEKALLR